jgi:phthiocerol/phenolphthiocerol synthesis type-I polyketide synthase C
MTICGFIFWTCSAWSWGGPLVIRINTRDRNSPVRQLYDDIAVVGWACRLPGANSVAELWSLLLEGRCAISQVPPDRFSLDRFGHPQRQERGKSYTWAAGIIDDLWGFDPSVFGISPREAEQMDPQQRILLQLTWEALEDAGIRPSSIAKSDVGVFIGASQTDYGHAFFGDHAIADAQFATGTAVAILANRISYIYDLVGPSLTVDTACSSSLVALHQAVEALQSGRIETAIVGGTNAIASPASFIAFSQANMLSAAGLCQAFSAKADGFVRAEGAVVLVLRKATYARANRNPVHGLVLASDVNSDGRTSGISLPNVDAQEALLRRIYSRNGIDVDRLAFIEAHGTGTPVGDPVEATAIGRSIGRDRSSSLPIGSIKTNIGHLEPASGLAGMVKALLALNHGILPPSLHFTEPNPNIDFKGFNLAVCDRPLLLPKSAEHYAGVNSFGFGGTNAHVVVAGGNKASAVASESRDDSKLFALSANSGPSLASLARTYAEIIEPLSDRDTARLASAIVYRREHQSNRIVISSTGSKAVVRALEAFIAGERNSHLTVGSSIGKDLPIAFVFSGNGSQYVGMGHSAYRNNVQFRARFDHVDGYFKEIGGWSLKDALFSDSLQDRLPLTSIAQPLIFAIQVACTAALRAGGLKPAAVLGHSVGEVAAAEAAGILDLRGATKVIYFRSTHQELIKGAGRMAAVLAPYETARQLAEEVGNVEIAAINSPRAVTVAGPADALGAFKRLAERRGIALLDLDLDYPFHTTLMAPIEQLLKKDLASLTPREGDIPFVSTVTGDCLLGSRMSGQYWWRNVREPVQFVNSIRAAAKLGARYFVEIGPRGMLFKHIADSLQGEVNNCGTLSVLDRSDSDTDPFDNACAKAIVGGAQVELRAIFGQDPGPEISLPHYPWQQTQFRFRSTPEAIGVEQVRHPFAGSRYTADSLEWHAHIDTAVFPKLIDHKVGGQVIFPGTGFLEIALTVTRQWLQVETVLVTGFEILNPLDLSNGETHEVMTRISAGSNTVEIFSRPRLSQAAWLLHCRGKIAAGDSSETARGPNRPDGGQAISGDVIYRLAEGGSLNYGPAFRLLQSAAVHEGGYISVALAPQTETTPFLLDPMRLDASAHGFFTLFPELRAEERGVTYIPVRIEETSLYRPHNIPERAVIEVVSKSERSILANCFIHGSEGELIAILRGVRSQAVPIKRKGTIESIALVERLEHVDGSIVGQTGVAVGVGDVIAEAHAIGVAANESASPEAALLLEGWATAAAYEIASALAERDLVDVDLLIARGQLPEELRSWLVNVLLNLEAAGLAKREAGSWILIKDLSLPNSDAVVKALAAEYPSRAAELLLAGAISGFAGEVASNRAIAASAGSILPNSVLDFYNATNVVISAATDTLYQTLRNCKKLWPETRALRVLQIGYGPLIHSLASHPQGGDILLTVFEPDRRRHENAAVALSKNSDVVLIDEANYDKLGTFDLIVAAGGLHRLPSGFSLDDLNGMLAPNGLLAAIELSPSLFRDFVLGLDPSWFVPGLFARPVSRLQSGEEWTTALGRAGFRSAETTQIHCGSDSCCLIVAGAGQSRADIASKAAIFSKASAVLVSSSGRTPLTAKLAERLAAGRAKTLPVVNLLDQSVSPPDMVILAPAAQDDHVNPVEALTQRCLEIKACAEAIGSKSATLWLIFSGALDSGASQLRPVEKGAWAFSRTLANEFQKLDVRRIDIEPRVPADLAAEQIEKIVCSGTAETELHLSGTAIHAVRVRPLSRVLEHKVASSKMAARLERRSTLGQRLSWAPVQRRQPGAGEVEIEVEATGVNFRDLMWMLSLLPDDMLEDGFTGPTLGLECAGRIARVGPSVKGLKPGDRVMAFAASSFASHATVQSSQVVKLSDRISCEAAATIPVAFLTAYYSLVTLAKLRKREWVLIHGGAGGVGMAAIQIAQSRGARVIATAGSPSKRSLLRALGVKHVFDSRSTTFVDDIHAIARAGVDVVLNSLAGAAMERSISCLRPFGRFIELGKRDYVFNTHIGLRPFRKNLSYFGVDVDQLIVGQRALSRRVYSKIISQFEDGKLTPLPFSVFDAASVSEAFYLMQHSGHIGKILVRPPSQTSVRPARKPLQISTSGTHVITGAFGGFGLETAKWLAERGARHLVMIGRRGAASSEAKAVVDELTSRGVAILADPCDVTNRKAVESLFKKVRATMPPVVGVLHEAMVLDDAALSNLDAERFRRVLAPKVAGAENLDLATRGLPLDYFVLFSSVTTLIGNPGQGNYVAANAYMEGLAHRRRQEGLPALAIGWGPIIDVGVVARDQKLQAGLQKLTGVTGMRAHDALQLMAEALEQQSESHDGSAMTISPNDGSFGGDRLPVLRSPTYASFISQEKYGNSETSRIDLRALAANEGVEAARRKVADVITDQLAHVLHSREEDISRTRALGELGLDSLMALELVMNLEECFGIRIPLVGASGSMTIASMADEVIAHFKLDDSSEDAVATTLAEQHQTNVEASQIEALKEFMSEEAQRSRRLLS